MRRRLHAFLFFFLAAPCLAQASASDPSSVAERLLAALHTSPIPHVSQIPIGTTCTLDMTMTCASGVCTSTTTNTGSNVCTGEYVAAFIGTGPSMAVSGESTTLGLPTCLDSSMFPVAAEAISYCVGTASLGPGSSFTATTHVSSTSGSTGSLPVIGITEVNDIASKTALGFVYVFNSAQVPTCTPHISVPPITQSGLPYTVSWTTVTDTTTSFQVDESTSADFSSGVTSSTVTGLSKVFSHAVSQTTTYYYRVRANSCSGSAGPFSVPGTIVVQFTPPATPRGTDAAVPFGSTQPVSFSVFLPGASGKIGPLGDTPYSAVTDKPYLTVTPAAGTIPPGGVTLTVTADPKSLPPGANTGTVTVINPSNSSTISQTPVSVSMVTPVTPGGKTLPPGNALIIPVVTHVVGAAGPFQSDVRVTNGSPSVITYQVTFTPSGTDGTQNGKSTQVPIESGQTIALNDIAKDFFGFGATGQAGDTGFGSLEIRPLNSSSTATYASSRTYVTASVPTQAGLQVGTLGQFVAAIPFSNFATNVTSLFPSAATPTKKLSLQQVAESAKFYTNFGLAEGSGSAASGHINIYDDSGAPLASVPYSLLAGEQKQIGHFISLPQSSGGGGIPSLTDGRIEVTVESPTGAVTAYASVLDTTTTDPLAVAPVNVSAISATRYIVPGMADLPAGITNFHSDMRVFNGGSTPVTVTATYYPQGNGTPKAAAPFVIAANEVKAFDNVLPTLFSVVSSGGSVVLTTTSASSLVATGRTYSNASAGGTYGQFIPGVTPAQGIGVGDRSLQILQLEQSQNFRSNLGLAELTGNSADVHITLILPDSKTAPSTDVHLSANEFLQLGSVIGSLNPGNTYNARITVQVTGGTGRVTAYGSVIDNVTSDPTYVPAQ